MGLGRVWPDVGPSYCLCRRGDGRYSRIQVVVVDAVRTVMNGSVRDDDSLLRRSAGERMEQVQECLVVLAPRDTFTLSSRAEPVPQTVRNDCLLDACTVITVPLVRGRSLPNLQPCPLSLFMAPSPLTICPCILILRDSTYRVVRCTQVLSSTAYAPSISAYMQLPCHYALYPSYGSPLNARRTLIL